MSTSTKKHQRGLGLVECLISCAVLGTLLSQALPAMRELKQRQQVNGLAETVMTDLMQARSEALRLGQSVQVRFSSHPTGSCYVMHVGASGDCSCDSEGRAVCTAEGALALKVQWIPLQQAASVKANVGNMTFSGSRGTVSPTGSIDIAATDRRATIRHVVSLAGRVRSCSPDRSVSRLNACA
ncbi:GspH/FimT family pseudopilin [Pelomonas sp. V22]|uniref:GspH/FimT family pseudopilin n=1 Tax=Pelomonas sp. V22 TaxID=2822139 RepID=UPI0024A94F24|nr:GspH/FimT family pseudopilin [Pelomonas sp. V22]MDI4631504.1 GspH/FimT family pseudopilin [Pelomonas sp. V22]